MAYRSWGWKDPCLWMVVILLAVPLVVVGPVFHADAATTGGSASGILPGYQQATSDQLSPLVITTLAPDPVPVKGSDNEFHVHYELSVFNDAPRAATITKVETLSNGRSRKVTHTITGSEIVARSLLTASYPTTPAPVAEIPAGRTLILVLDDVYPTRQAVPASVTHRISATFGPITSGDGGPASLYPDHATQFGGPVTTSTLGPLVIAPPIAGSGWEASNGCCGLNAHGNVVLPLGGRLNGAERFAVDWVRVNLAAKPLVENGMEVTWEGDPSVNQSYLAFDQPVLAVADGTVVSVVSDLSLIHI